MNLLTYGDAKNDISIQTMAGVCNTTEQFRQRVNAAIRRIMRRGDFPGTVPQFQFCTFDNCLVFPNFVGAVRAVNICGHPIPVKNSWYEFMQFGNGTLRSGCFKSDYVIEQRGRTPVFRNVPCGNDNCYVRFYPRCQKDLGKTVTLWGTDTNGQTIRTRDADDNWTEGMTLTLGLPFVSTSTTVRHIERIRKDATQCPVDVFIYDSVNNVLINCASYSPSETNPSYISSVVGSAPGCCLPVASCVSKNYLVLFKMAQIDVVDDTDILPVQNLEAIASMIMSARKREGGDLQGAAEEEANAIHEMNLQDRDEAREDTVPVEVAIFGRSRLQYKRIGSIM